MNILPTIDSRKRRYFFQMKLSNISEETFVDARNEKICGRNFCRYKSGTILLKKFLRMTDFQNF